MLYERAAECFLALSVRPLAGVPLQGDLSAGKMIFGVDGVDPARRARLIELLDIDLYQRMNTMSDGQRRRVQIAMGLLKPYQVRRPRRAPQFAAAAAA
eukprot:350891-Chlamydomonas_euryale.AAC.6